MSPSMCRAPSAPQARAEAHLLPQLLPQARAEAHLLPQACAEAPLFSPPHRLEHSRSCQFASLYQGSVMEVADEMGVRARVPILDWKGTSQMGNGLEVSDS